MTGPAHGTTSDGSAGKGDGEGASHPHLSIFHQMQTHEPNEAKVGTTSGQPTTRVGPVDGHPAVTAPKATTEIPGGSMPLPGGREIHIPGAHELPGGLGGTPAGRPHLDTQGGPHVEMPDATSIGGHLPGEGEHPSIFGPGFNNRPDFGNQGETYQHVGPKAEVAPHEPGWAERNFPSTTAGAKQGAEIGGEIGDTIGGLVGTTDSGFGAGAPIAMTLPGGPLVQVGYQIVSVTGDVIGSAVGGAAGAVVGAGQDLSRTEEFGLEGSAENPIDIDAWQKSNPEAAAAGTGGMSSNAGGGASSSSGKTSEQTTSEPPPKEHPDGKSSATGDDEGGDDVGGNNHDPALGGMPIQLVGVHTAGVVVGMGDGRPPTTDKGADGTDGPGGLDGDATGQMNPLNSPAATDLHLPSAGGVLPGGDVHGDHTGDGVGTGEQATPAFDPLHPPELLIPAPDWSDGGGI